MYCNGTRRKTRVPRRHEYRLQIISNSSESSQSNVNHCSERQRFEYRSNELSRSFEPRYALKVVANAGEHLYEETRQAKWPRSRSVRHRFLTERPQMIESPRSYRTVRKLWSERIAEYSVATFPVPFGPYTDHNLSAQGNREANRNLANASMIQIFPLEFV